MVGRPAGDGLRTGLVRRTGVVTVLYALAIGPLVHVLLARLHVALPTDALPTDRLQPA